MLFLALFFYKSTLHCHIATEDDPHLPGYIIISPVLIQFKLNQASLLVAETCAVHRIVTIIRLNSTTNNLSLFLLRLIILSGDISLNPGPNWRYPCGVCKNPVKSNQNGLQCDSCDTWYHTRCCSIGDETYTNLANTSCTWICCECNMPNFSRSLSEGPDVTQDNYFQPLSALNSSFGSFQGSPKLASSPKICPPPPSSFHQMPPKKSAKKNASLRCLLLNCQSVKSKRAELEHVIEKYNPDLLLGTESWLTPDITNGEILPSD